MSHRAAVGLLIASAALGGACASRAITPAQTRPGAVAIAAAGLRAEWAPDIDRVVWFGPSGGPNLLHVSPAIERAPDGSGAYTFFGGCYTWVAPQGGPLGWKSAAGADQPWPPDPAMDIGPARVTAMSHSYVSITSPESLAGLVEVKTLRLDYQLQAELTFELRNQADAARLGASWIITAAPPTGVLAIRAPDGTEYRGWNQESVDRVRSITGPPAASGWAPIDLRAATWDEGAKVYITAPGPERRAEIAIWTEGYWFLRQGELVTDAQAQQLREVDEGPVAVYIEPDARIVEAELYSPLTEISPGGAFTTTERWTVIPSPHSADLSLLPD